MVEESLSSPKELQTNTTMNPSPNVASAYVANVVMLEQVNTEFLSSASLVGT